MIVKVTVTENGSTPVIARVELTGLASIGTANAYPSYLVEVTSEANLNKLLNDYAHIGVAYTDAGRTGITLSFDGAAEAVGTRFVPAGNWKTYTRPAWFRAATTTSFFNA